MIYLKRKEKNMDCLFCKIIKKEIPSEIIYEDEDIFKVANSRLGWYRRSGMNVVNFIISKDLLENRIKDGAGLLNPLSYYLVKVGI